MFCKVRVAGYALGHRVNISYQAGTSSEQHAKPLTGRHESKGYCASVYKKWHTERIAK